MNKPSINSEYRELFEQICAAFDVVDQDDRQALITLYQPLFSGEMTAHQHYGWLKEQYERHDR